MKQLTDVDCYCNGTDHDLVETDGNSNQFYRKFKPGCEKTGLWGFPSRSDKNWTVQPQKMAGGLKFRI